ncbi:hypothetical protein BJF79_39905 [Actinomadura sp. CNU-125]|uniref:WS/DGAT domain-containing protein n=1 Tax=Actinomadura sp. CNU-125 TaxID=1904961 RepID=UPI00095D2FC1|nr:WS/DGAT domain-containing protein [Actinomadura sp. CNU-125]OLT30019.1 hypothetical protein BJF79_39905 [Actinomadura sp. CNU-125]
MEGNHTSAVMVDLPIGAMAEPARLADIARRSTVLRSGTRALAAWFVMRQAGRLMPVPLHARFARAAYSERFLQGIVSSLPGPGGPLRLAGAPLAAVYPVVPLAPGAPPRRRRPRRLPRAVLRRLPRPRPRRRRRRPHHRDRRGHRRPPHRPEHRNPGTAGLSPAPGHPPSRLPLFRSPAALDGRCLGRPLPRAGAA